MSIKLQNSRFYFSIFIDHGQGIDHIFPLIRDNISIDSFRGQDTCMIHMRFHTLLCVTWLIFLPASLHGTRITGTGNNYYLEPAAEPIAVDGVMSEDVWSRLPVAGGFWMSYPVDDRGVDEGLRTEVRLTFDDQFLYIGKSGG